MKTGGSLGVHTILILLCRSVRLYTHGMSNHITGDTKDGFNMAQLVAF